MRRRWRKSAFSPADSPFGTIRAGEWILILDSLDIGTYTFEQAVSHASGLGPAVAVDSSTVPGLRPGYWAIVSRTSYPSSDEAQSHCGDHGREASSACHPQMVTG